MTRSAPEATSAGRDAATAPSSTSHWTAIGFRSYTATSKPPFRMLRAIGRPMLPSPMTPTLRTRPLRPSILGDGRALLGRQVALLVVRQLDHHTMQRPGERERHGVLLADSRAVVAATVEA